MCNNALPSDGWCAQREAALEDVAAGQATIAELETELGMARTEHTAVQDQLKAALSAAAAAGVSTCPQKPSHCHVSAQQGLCSACSWAILEYGRRLSRMCTF